MRQRLLVLLGRTRRRVGHGLGSLLPLVGLPLLVVGCAGHSLVPAEQSAAIADRERALAPHAAAIQAAIRQSGNIGGLAFLDTGDGHLVVLPGDTPVEAWGRYASSPDGGTAREAVPEVVTFVHRADVPKAPEAVTRSALQQLEATRKSMAALEADLRDAHGRVEERLALVRRELAESIAATKGETDKALADTQRQLAAFAEDLATVRRFMLQTAQLGWLNHDLTVENANGIRKVATASKELIDSSVRLEDTLRRHSESLASQLKELAKRLDTIQGKVENLK
jgi:hypothetical protein